MTAYLSTTFPGETRKKESYQFFLPADIFLTQHLTFDLAIQKQLEQATLVLGQFSAKITSIPNIELFISSYINKEAVQSSRIEGTKTEIDGAFEEDETEIDPEKRDDWKELHQYIAALKNALSERQKLPICERLIRNAHSVLLDQNRGKNKSPGQYRKSQNWIGGSRPDNAHFVPPSPELVGEAMKNLEAFIQDEKIPIPDLIKIALIHFQFETIHPFLDGNGRIGRMLIPLYLLEKNILQQPILYISDFFEKNRRAYYDSLDYARSSQDGVIKWVSFFLDGVVQTAKQGIITTDKINTLQNNIFHEKIPTLGRRAKNATKLAQLLFHKPFVDSIRVRRQLEISPQAAQNLLASFVKLNILKEVTGYKRNRQFIFKEYLNILKA
ncbi:Fic family protein [Candidatus Peregrinibacteria bacterium]|nr:MAG: Fic family protein [Candidatus Peregrinibacteria bacterium]